MWCHRVAIGKEKGSKCGKVEGSAKSALTFRDSKKTRKRENNTAKETKQNHTLSVHFPPQYNNIKYVLCVYRDGAEVFEDGAPHGLEQLSDENGGDVVGRDHHHVEHGRAMKDSIDRMIATRQAFKKKAHTHEQ